MQELAPRLQCFPAFPDFVEEVRSSWDRPASATSISKQATLLSSLESANKLGLVGFPPVDSTNAALVSGLQGQALGLVEERRQLWLSQARVPEADKAVLLDAPISPGHTFGPAVEEILQKSLRDQEASHQVAALLPPRASAWNRSPEGFQSPQPHGVT
ncbi:UNVERIFIED_CONTAM: hypothetical protein FKN15_022546 [Acipenser sinensis]